jgi:hypothetical protein
LGRESEERAPERPNKNEEMSFGKWGPEYTPTPAGGREGVSDSTPASPRYKPKFQERGVVLEKGGKKNFQN